MRFSLGANPQQCLGNPGPGPYPQRQHPKPLNPGLLTTLSPRHRRLHHDSRQFLSSLMSPQSLSKSHHQMLLMQLPLLQRYWFRRHVFSRTKMDAQSCCPALAQLSPPFLPPGVLRWEGATCRDAGGTRRMSPNETHATLPYPS